MQIPDRSVMHRNIKADDLENLSDSVNRELAAAETLETATAEASEFRVQTEFPLKLGTPLSDSAIKVLLLGAGELGKEVVIAFQRLGVEVHAADRYANAPAHHVAHFSYVIDINDEDELYQLIETIKPNFVVPEIEAIATAALLRAETDGLAEVIPTARAAALTMDREGIRRLAAEELGLPTSPYAFADSAEELRAAAEEIGYPVVVKPVMSSSGKGQSIVQSSNDIDKAWEVALDAGRVKNSRVIVEGFIEFDYEITLLTVRAIDSETGELTTHFCAPIGHVQRGGDYVESWQPHSMEPQLLENATSIAARIAGGLGNGGVSGRGVFGVELFIKDQLIFFSEVSPRPHDTGLVTIGSQRLSEFELHARAILGMPVDVELISPGASAVIYGGVDAQAISFENVAQALVIPESEILLFGKPESFTRRRMGVAIATADSVAEARGRAVEAARRVTPSAGEAENFVVPPADVVADTDDAGFEVPVALDEVITVEPMEVVDELPVVAPQTDPFFAVDAIPKSPFAGAPTFAGWDAPLGLGATGQSLAETGQPLGALVPPVTPGQPIQRTNPEATAAPKVEKKKLFRRFGTRN